MSKPCELHRLPRRQVQVAASDERDNAEARVDDKRADEEPASDRRPPRQQQHTAADALHDIERDYAGRVGQEVARSIGEQDESGCEPEYALDLRSLRQDLHRELHAASGRPSIKVQAIY
jgi:hypothetical protein